MTRGLRIVATGTELRVPDVDWEIVDAGELDGWRTPTGSAAEWRRGSLDDDDDALAALREHARAQGAVLALVEDRDGDLSPIVVLRADAAWNVLEVDGEPRGLFADPRGELPFVALVSGALHTGAGQPCPRTTFVQRHAPAWVGDRWRLLPHPSVHRPGRAWCWRGARTSFGPHSLTVHCAAAADVLDGFLSALAPMPYDRADATRYVARRELDEDQRIEVRDGALCWLRRSGEPAAPLATFDAGVLHAIAGGALGAIDWLACEHDWEAPVALGDDGASLADYLSGDEARVEAEQARRVEPHHLDGEQLTPAALIGRLSILLGAATPVADEDFDAWLASLDLAGVPRHVSIRIAGPPAALHARLARCQRRIVWRVSGRG